MILEIAPGIYTAPNLNAAVRDRVWPVLSDWFGEIGGGLIVMTWRDPKAPGRQAIAKLGLPPRTLVDHEGLVLVKRAL